MESEWRWNVYDKGLTNLDFFGLWAPAVLCARLVGEVNKFLVKREWANIWWAEIWLCPPNVAPSLWQSIVPRPAPPFPWGYNVDPD